MALVVDQLPLKCGLVAWRLCYLQYLVRRVHSTLFWAQLHRHTLSYLREPQPLFKALSRSSKTYDNQKLSRLQRNKHSEQYTVSTFTASGLSQRLRHIRPAVFRQVVFRHGFLFMWRLQDRTPPTNVFNRSVSFKPPSFYQFSCSDLTNFSNLEAQKPNEKLIIRNHWIRTEMLFITRMGEERRRERSLV